jgi:cysteine-rich repeat protein
VGVSPSKSRIPSRAWVLAAAVLSGCPDDPIPAAPVIERFEGAPMLVEPGEDSKLSWKVIDAERISITSTSAKVFDTVEPEGVVMVRAITTDTVFSLSATNPIGTSVATLKIGIRKGPPPVIGRFDVSPMTIAPSETATLAWETTNATQVDITTAEGSVVSAGPGDGTFFVSPGATTTYRLVASSRGGTDSREVTLTVDDPRPDITAFTADPASIALGGISTLAWSVLEAGEIAIFAGPAEIVRTAEGSGTATVAPALTTEYELVARNTFGTTSARVTVEVDVPSPPAIVRFAAVPNPIALSDPTSLEWNAVDADQIRIYEGATEIAARTLPIGSLSVTPAGVETAYRLEAENENGISGATVIVYAHDLPGIDAFTAAPSTFVASSTVVLTFGVRSAASLDLMRNGASIAGFPVTLSATAALDRSASVPVPIAATSFFDLVATSAAGSVSASAIAVRGFFETEPNDVPATADPHPGDGTDAAGMSGVDVYAVVVPANGNVFADTFDARGDCSTTDTELILYGTNGTTVLGSDDDSGPGACARIDPNALPAATNLTAGTYFVVVRGDRAAPYAVTIRATGPGCGNGLLEGAEACDDGDTIAEDGCSASCALEGIPEDEAGGNDLPMAPGVLATGIDARFFGAIEPGADTDHFAVVVPQGYHLDAYVTVNSLTRCTDPARASLTLIAPNGVTELATNDDGGPDDRCGRIGIDTTPFALGMAAGTYFLRIDPIAADPIGTYFLHVRIVQPGCGNDLVEPGETCDDGNDVGGDGCGATCQWEIGPTINPPGGTASLTLPGAGAAAIVRVDINGAGQSIGAVAADPGLTTCTVDTALELRDATFDVLGMTSAGGPGSCAALVPGVDRFATDLAIGPYYLYVRSEAGAGPVELGVTITNPSCGNGIREARVGEHCDDMNTASGDGCSSICRLESSSGVEMEPNDDQASANATALVGLGTYTVTGATNPSGDDDVYSFVVPPGPVLRLTARTYSTPGNPASCNITTTDTRIFLEVPGFESTGPGTGEIGYNDDRDPANNIWCSEIANRPLGAGTYYLRVQGWNDTQATQYLFDVTLSP